MLLETDNRAMTTVFNNNAIHNVLILKQCRHNSVHSPDKSEVKISTCQLFNYHMSTEQLKYIFILELIKLLMNNTELAFNEPMMEEIMRTTRDF